MRTECVAFERLARPYTGAEVGVAGKPCPAERGLNGGQKTFLVRVHHSKQIVRRTA